MLIRAIELSGPSEAWGWSFGSLFILLSPECCPEPKAIWQGWLCMFWISHFASGISLASSFSQSLLWALRQTLPLATIWQWSAVPTSVSWKVVFVYFSRRALLCIGIGLMGWCPGIYTCVGICGRVMHRDLSFLFQEGRSMNVAVSSVLTAAEYMACLVA